VAFDQILAVGPNLEAAVWALCERVQWEPESFTITNPLEAKVILKDGQEFTALGLNVPGGVILTEWY
jgi:hypothetical protein